MKNNKTCESSMILSIVLVSSLIVAMVLPGKALARIEPAGRNIGAVRFDAVIELNRYHPRSLRHDYTLMFARYWVARDCYSAAVVWSEPQSTDRFFAVHPPSLSVVSNNQGFKVRHELDTKQNKAYEKPLGERGVLRHKFGSYPIGNIRFAEREALSQRIYAADLGGMKAGDKSGAEVLDVSIPAANGGESRDVTSLKIQRSGERIDSVKLFNADNRLLKDISYKYENKGGKARLRKQTVVLPERPMMVGFNGEGMKVTLDGKEYTYRDLEATHHAGGRTCTVEYEPVTIGDKEVTLPVEVTVRGGQDKRILRCVRMMNFKKVELDAAGAEEEARRFGAVTADQREYRELRLKYWKKAPIEISKQDVEAIEQLRGRFEKAAAAAGSSPGERLKYLNILMNLDVILGDHSGLERHYQCYLSTLDNKLHWMTLVGGYGVIETSMFAERHTDAEKLLSLWVDAVLGMHDDGSTLLFARRQLAKGRVWTTAVLLEAFLKKKRCPADARFEAAVLRCSALAELCKLLRTRDVAKKGLIAKVQVDWVASIGKDSVDKLLADSMDQASRCFASMPAPTESQQALKKQVDKIDTEISKEKNDKPS